MVKVLTHEFVGSHDDNDEDIKHQRSAVAVSILSKVRDVLYGKETLGRTFWLWWLLPYLVISMVVLPRLAYIPRGTAFYVALAVVSLVILGQWSAFACAVWNSAGNAKSKAWGAVARTWVILAVAPFFSVTIPSISAVFHGYTTPNQIQSAVSAMQSKLPERLSNHTTWTRVTYQNYTMNYFYEVSLEDSKSIDWKAIRRTMLRFSCSMYKAQRGTEALRAVTHTYQVNGQSAQVIEVRRTDCTSSGT
jgi:hypothetical protein